MEGLFASPSDQFLGELIGLKNEDCLFFKTSTIEEKKKLSSRIRTRLWRYAESGHIKFREFNLFSDGNGLKLMRNLNPFDNHEKRNGGRRTANENL